jgi:hypothetical protein
VMVSCPGGGACCFLAAILAEGGVVVEEDDVGGKVPYKLLPAGLTVVASKSSASWSPSCCRCARRPSRGSCQVGWWPTARASNAMKTPAFSLPAPSGSHRRSPSITVPGGSCGSGAQSAALIDVWLGGEGVVAMVGGGLVALVVVWLVVEMLMASTPTSVELVATVVLMMLLGDGFPLVVVGHTG